MKKLLLIIILIVSVLNINAQKTVQGSGFLDDWSVTALTGITTPTTHSAFWGNMRPTYGVEMTKYIVPEFALGAQFLTSHNTTTSANTFDATHLMLLGTLNLSNWLGSYYGHPRFFELEAVVGSGWGHHFYPISEGGDANFMVSKIGVNLNFFLGKEYAWSIGVKPSIVYNMDTGHGHPTYNVNQSALEFLIGATYHFKNANNGKRYFTHQRAYDHTEIDALNAKVNGLREQLSVREAELQKANQTIHVLRQKLEENETEIR